MGQGVGEVGEVGHGAGQRPEGPHHPVAQGVLPPLQGGNGVLFHKGALRPDPALPAGPRHLTHKFQHFRMSVFRIQRPQP